MGTMINSITFGSDTYPLSLPYGVCEVAAGTVAKTVTVDNFYLEKGASVIVKFTYANTAANPTLKVNDTEAKPIYWHGAALTSSQYWQAGATLQFVYNGTQWELIGVAKDNNNTYTVNNATITIDAGTKLNTGGTFTVNQSSNKTITINHDETTRTDGTATAVSPGYAGKFTVVDSVSSDATGHVTGIKTKEVTMPSAVDISGKMDKENPTGTGSFSLNRKADTTIGNYSFAEGYNTTASGMSAHAEGYATTASNHYSHAEGIQTTASGEYSHAEGRETTASGYASHAEGQNTVASEMSSHAEGYNTTASGTGAHAEGATTTASGETSHAEGNNTIASGYASHTEGYETTANSVAQHVQGEYNILDIENANARGTYAHIVGNGTGDDARSNAHTLDWDGNAWFAGDVYVNSTSGTNKDTGSKKLATEEYVGNQITANAPNLTNYKTVQTAVSNPTASGSASAFIDSISQDTNGKITVTKKNLSLPSILKFIGTTTTSLTDGATTNPITIGGSSVTVVSGNVVILSGTDQEFLWTGSAWEEFGNASGHSVKGHTHTVTHKPAGSVSQPTFTGTAVTSGANSGTNQTVSLNTHKHSVTAAGTVSQPTFTGSSVTSGANSGNVVANITTSIANRCFTFTIDSSTTHTHAVTAAGTVSKPTFTGSAVTSVAPADTYGTSVAPGGHTHSVTAAGTVSKPTFTGTSATLTTSGSNS